MNSFHTTHNQRSLDTNRFPQHIFSYPHPLGDLAMLRQFSTFKVMILVLTLGVSSFSLASTITPQGSEVKFISGGSYPADYLHIVAPNSAGISVNRFNVFSVSGKPLNIVNPGSVGTIPTTIVIIANHISLRDTVEIVGDAADVVFISETSTSTI